jgi:flagellar motor switch protein FliM
VSEAATLTREQTDSQQDEDVVEDRSVHLLDFSQPTKFTTELRRRIGRLLVPFCKATSARLVSDLRTQVELQQVDAHQLSWSAARATLAEDAILVAVNVKPIGKQMLLALDQQLVWRALDSMLGGSAESAPQARKLTDIDWALTRRFAEAIVLQLSLVWRDLGGLELSVEEIDLDGDAGVVIPISEPTFAVDFEVSISGLESKLSLLIPWGAVEPVAEGILSAGSVEQDVDPRQARALQQGLAAAKLLVRAEIGATNLPVEHVLAIERGSTVNLKAKADLGVRLLAERVALARGTPGCSGVRRAVKLTTPISPETDHAARSLTLSHSDRGGSRKQTRAMLERLTHIRGVELRVWAELGRTRMSLSEALRLPKGAVLELDEGAGDPVELFVNGLAFASGSLLVTDEGEWAVQVSALA